DVGALDRGTAGLDVARVVAGEVEDVEVRLVVLLLHRLRQADRELERSDVLHPGDVAVLQLLDVGRVVELRDVDARLVGDIDAVAPPRFGLALGIDGRGAGPDVQGRRLLDRGRLLTGEPPRHRTVHQGGVDRLRREAGG